MQKKKSPRQMLREQESARKKRKKEIEAEYPEMVKDWKETGWDEHFSIPEKKSWISRKLAEWESQQPLIITGKYQDKEKIISTYQQKFVDYVRQLCPYIIEELREFAHYFNDLFRGNKDKYLNFFDWHKDEFFNFSFSLETYINSQISIFPLLEFRPNQTETFRYDYKWGEDRLTLNFFYLLLVKENEKKSKQILDDTTELLRSELVFRRDLPNFPKEIDEVILQSYIDAQTLSILQDILFNKQNYYFSGAREVITKYLKDISTDAEPNIEAFLALQVALLKWAETHNLKKDWFLKYAYYFLKQFSDNPDIKVSEIDVGYLEGRTLEAFPFSFKFDSWFAGDEKREIYEKRLKEKFASELERYFQSAGRYLELNKIKKFTKPPDYDRAKWLVRWTVQGWSKDQILEEIDKEFQKQDIEKYYTVRTIELAFQQFKEYELPVK